MPLRVEMDLVWGKYLISPGRAVVMYRANKVVISGTIYDDDAKQNPRDLVGSTLTFVVRETPTSSEAKIVKQTGGGGIEVDANGGFTITILPSNTLDESVMDARNHVYELRGRKGDDEFTLAQSSFVLKEDVTEAAEVFSGFGDGFDAGFGFGGESQSSSSGFHPGFDGGFG